MLSPHLYTISFSLFPSHDREEYYYSQKTIFMEERPLHLLISKNNLYFASLSEHLYAIRNNEKEIVYKCGDNILYEIEKGEIVKRTPYDREHIKEEIIKSKHTYTKNKSNSNVIVHSSSRHFPATEKYANVITEVNPQQFTFGRIYLYNGKYMRNGHVLNGMYFITNNDREDINNETSVKLYFFKGMWVRDEAAYDELNALNFITSPIKYMHPDSIYKSNFLYTIGEKYKIENGLITVDGRFCYYRYTFNSIGKLCNYVRINAPEVIEFNKAFDTSHKTNQECVDYFETTYGVEFDWEDFYSAVALGTTPERIANLMINDDLRS